MRTTPAIAVLLAACAGELENPELYATADCLTSTESLLRGTCAECHGGAEPAAALDFTVPDLASRLVGAMPTDGEDGACAGAGPLIDPEDPAASLLYTKVTEPACGDLMPMWDDALRPEQVSCLLVWIAAQTP